MSIPGLHGANPIQLAITSYKNFQRHDMMSYASALAYSILFALFPFLIFLIALLSTLDLSRFFDWLLDQSQSALPADAFAIVDRVIGEIQGQSRGGVLSVGVIGAIWASSSGVRSVMNAMNVVYEVEDARPTIRRYVLSVVYTLALAALFILSAGLVFFGPDAMTWIADHADLGDAVVTVWTWLRWPVLVLILMVAVALIYYAAPNVKQPFALITPGAVIAVVAWVVASYVFSFYLSRFGNYSATYGSLAGIIALLFFLYLSSAVLMLGAEINAEINRIRSTAQPVPSSPDQTRPIVLDDPATS